MIGGVLEALQIGAELAGLGVGTLRDPRDPLDHLEVVEGDLDDAREHRADLGIAEQRRQRRLWHHREPGHDRPRLRRVRRRLDVPPGPGAPLCDRDPFRITQLDARQVRVVSPAPT